MEERIRIMMPLLDERQRRIFLAAEAKSYGRGGIIAVSRLSGVAPHTIRRGLNEIENDNIVNLQERLRTSGGGRKTLQEKIPDIEEHIQEIVDGSAYGSPQKVLSYTTLSLRKIQGALAEDFGINISFRSVSSILEKLGYSKQTKRKMLQAGEPHPDRNEQFEFINSKAADFLEKGLPVISVETRKQDDIGSFKDEQKAKGSRKVSGNELLVPELEKVAPHGLYVLNDKTGFVNLGDHTAEFAAQSILRWWECVGQGTFPGAERIYINCDNGGSNDSGSRLWQYELQQLANYMGLEIHVSHIPPGTSKWNQIEHRLFGYIAKSGPGQPLVDIETVVNLVTSATAAKGRKIECQVDATQYELKCKAGVDEIAGVEVFPCERFGAWNYVVKPKSESTVK